MQTASDLGLEAHKTVKLESNTQLGYFLRVTKKVSLIATGSRGGGNLKVACLVRTKTTLAAAGGKVSAWAEKVYNLGDPQ